MVVPEAVNFEGTVAVDIIVGVVVIAGAVVSVAVVVPEVVVVKGTGAVDVVAGAEAVTIVVVAVVVCVAGKVERDMKVGQFKVGTETDDQTREKAELKDPQ